MYVCVHIYIYIHLGINKSKGVVCPVGQMYSQLLRGYNGSPSVKASILQVPHPNAEATFAHIPRYLLRSMYIKYMYV